MQKSIKMIKFETNFVPLVSEKRFDYAFNVPSERITFVKAGTVQRKNQASPAFSDAEKNTFINGIKAFNSSAAYPQTVGGRYDLLVSIHRHDWHRMHSVDGTVGTQRFLTWHRVYLQVLEQWLRGYLNYPNFFIPYWDWTANPSIPNWLENFEPSVNVPDTEQIPPTPSIWDQVNVYRTPGQQGEGFLPTSQDVNDCLAEESYTGFTLKLEWLHNGVHTWVGGTMSDIRTSAADPLFWLHHANIDRIYTLWQTTHPDNPDHIPNLSWPDTVMDPWSATEPQLRHSNWAEYV
jgi:tyrosinase